MGQLDVREGNHSRSRSDAEKDVARGRGASERRGLKKTGSFRPSLSCRWRNGRAKQVLKRRRQLRSNGADPADLRAAGAHLPLLKSKVFLFSFFLPPLLIQSDRWK